MGVNEQLIIMIGCNIGYDTYSKAGGLDSYDKFRIDIEGKENTGRIAVIADGMSGSYCVVGIPTYVSGRYDHFSDLSNNSEYNGLGFRGISEPTEEQVKEIQEFIKDNFKIVNAEIKMCVFVHYT